MEFMVCRQQNTTSGLQSRIPCPSGGLDFAQVLAEEVETVASQDAKLYFP